MSNVKTSVTLTQSEISKLVCEAYGLDDITATCQANISNGLLVSIEIKAPKKENSTAPAPDNR